LTQSQPSAGRATAIPLPHPSLAKDNIDATRRIKTLAQALPDLQKQLAALSTSVGMPDPTIEDVQRMEESYLALAEERKELDGQLARFEGLPSDIAEARLEVERRKAELRKLIAQRDEVFEGLVERETPKRPSRR
jgi:HAUS augmin-like complex subunit 1